MNSTRAFSMVELLVVITIMALLAGLLFALVGSGTAYAERTKDESLLRIVHDGLIRYKDRYVTYPPTPAEPFTSNRLAYWLCTPQDAVTPADRTSSVVHDDIPGTRITAEAITDHVNSAPLVYVFGSGADGTDRRTTIPLPADPWSDDANVTSTAFDGFSHGFTLWSRGPDGLAANRRSDPVNADNLSVSAPYGTLSLE